MKILGHIFVLIIVWSRCTDFERNHEQHDISCAIFWFWRIRFIVIIICFFFGPTEIHGNLILFDIVCFFFLIKEIRFLIVIILLQTQRLRDGNREWIKTVCWRCWSSTTRISTGKQSGHHSDAGNKRRCTGLSTVFPITIKTLM